MSKLVINPLVSGFPSVATLNANFEAIEAALENTVSRDGTTPNHLTADLDMNGHRILNALADSGEGFIYKGEWTTSTAYTINDLVYVTVGTGTFYDGFTLICKVIHTSGTLNTDYDAGKWGVIAARGASGSGSGDLVAANNLSDVDNAATARGNLSAARSGANSDITSLSALTTVPSVVLEAVQTVNYFYNPEMNVQQRPALTPANARQIGQVDRWAYQVGIGSLTATPNSLSGVPVDNRQVLNATVAFTGPNVHAFDQRLPARDCWKFGDKAITVSAYVFHNSSQTNWNWYIEVSSADALDNFSTKTTIHTGSNVNVPTGVWTRVTTTFTPTNAQVANGLEFQIRSVLSSGALSSHNVRLKDCQLEMGSSATAFSSRSYDEELAICRRFWRTSYLPGVNPGTANTSGALAFRQVITNETDHTGLREYFGIPMAKDPAITWYNTNNGAAGSLYDYSAGANRTISTTHMKSIYSTGYPVVSPGAGGAGAYCLVHYVVDAEL